MISYLQEVALAYNDMTPADLDRMETAVLEYMAEVAYGKDDQPAADDLARLVEDRHWTTRRSEPRTEAQRAALQGIYPTLETPMDLDEDERWSIVEEAA